MNLSRRGGSSIDAWAAQALAEIASTAPETEAGWTTKLAGEALIDALRWARSAAGRTGPAGYRGLSLPDDIPQMWVMPSPKQISRHLAALEWPAGYLIPAHTGLARMLGLLAACKVYKWPFDKTVKARGMSRATAYALRDRGLSIISQGLERERAPINVA
ncbi:MAG TPA: hypothetical protein VGC40_02145 [Paenirhodobacter sp.]